MTRRLLGRPPLPLRTSLGSDYVIPPLEGLWWAEGMDAFTTARDKSRWDWTMMLMAPDWIDRAMFASTAEQAGAKNPPARLDDVRLEKLSEGRCVQTLHVGSFDDEAEVLTRLHHEFMPNNGLFIGPVRGRNLSQRDVPGHRSAWRGSRPHRSVAR